MIETTTTAFTTEHTASTENCFEGSAPCRFARKSLSRSVAACVHVWLQRFAFLCALCVLSGGMALLTACESTRTSPDDDLPEEKPDQEIITGELQSDFLELGPQAGVQWLSFYPDDYLEYPELFEGYDRDQRRHLRLAPREGANKVLLKFDLPAGAKIKPVDWYGTECVAIDLPDQKGLTVALTSLGKGSERDLGKRLAETRCKQRAGSPPSDVEEHGGAWFAFKHTRLMPHYAAAYRVRDVEGRFALVVECAMDPKWVTTAGKETSLSEAQGNRESAAAALEEVIQGVRVVRDLNLEGSPKHQCKSTIDDLKTGIVAYEKGGLKLALPEGWSLRKTGGSSTVEIDGSGAKPLALIRRLKPHSNGDLRARVRADSVFARRCDRPDAFFGAGKSLTGAEPYVVSFDYRDNSVDQAALCVIATGNELLTIEVVATGLRDPQARRQARDALFAMLAQAEPSTQVRNAVQGLDKLVGWKPKE